MRAKRMVAPRSANSLDAMPFVTGDQKYNPGTLQLLLPIFQSPLIYCDKRSLMNFQGSLRVILTIQSRDHCSSSTHMCSLSSQTHDRLSHSLTWWTSFLCCIESQAGQVRGLSNDVTSTTFYESLPPAKPHKTGAIGKDPHSRSSIPPCGSFWLSIASGLHALGHTNSSGRGSF